MSDKYFMEYIFCDNLVSLIILRLVTDLVQEPFKFSNLKSVLFKVNRYFIHSIIDVYINKLFSNKCI